jgi:hypothetical protein
MDTKKISPEQRKIIIIGFALILAFLIFWIFIYLPSQNEVRRLQTQLMELDSQTRGIEMIIDKARTIDEGLNALKEEYGRLNKFSSQAEESLRLVSEYARKLNIEMLSIKSQPKILASDIGSCLSILVSVEAKSSYKTLLRYLQIIKNNLPTFTTIERLKIDKDNSKSKNLNVILDLKLYLLP